MTCARFVSTMLCIGLFLDSPVLAQQPASTDESKAPSVRQRFFQRGVVAADHRAASAAGVEILKLGGNVIDAAVATSFALSVVRPASCGIGGGGFMVIWNADRREAVALDYRERAPQAATRDMYAGSDDGAAKLRESSRKGHLAVAVPGTVAGLCYALEHYGSLDLRTVMRPALDLARRGVPADRHQCETQAAILESLEKSRGDLERFRSLHALYLNGGRRWKPGDRVRSTQARVLELIAERGADGFYRGPVAEALVAESQRGGGLLTLDDLAETKPVIRPVLRGRFDRYDVITMPPPSSGGVALLESLNILSAYEAVHPARRLDRLGHNRTDYLHLLSEAMKHAFADRAEFLGDPDFSPVPVARLTSVEYAERLAKRVNIGQTGKSDSYGRYQPVDDAGTSHFCVIDQRGNAVACTETINTRYGSYVVEPRFGILLNNEMDDFAARPGEPNAFGLIQSEANAVGAGRKPLSSMTPTIVVQDGRAAFALGASGGPRIISASLQVLLNLTRLEMSPAAAVAAPRIHHQWQPDDLLIEETLVEEHRESLEQRGHQVKSSTGLAAVQAVLRSVNGLAGASDQRKGGRPAGF